MKCTKCKICDGSFAPFRKHCPYCASIRMFLVDAFGQAKETHGIVKDGRMIEVARAIKPKFSFVDFSSSAR